MAALVEYNLNIDAGATYPAANGPAQFYITNDDGSVFDLTGFTASMQIRKTATASTVAASVIPSVNTATGCVSFTIPAATTSTLTDSPYVYALELHASTADPVIRLAEGRVLVSPEVVR